VLENAWCHLVRAVSSNDKAESNVLYKSWQSLLPCMVQLQMNGVWWYQPWTRNEQAILNCPAWGTCCLPSESVFKLRENYLESYDVCRLYCWLMNIQQWTWECLPSQHQQLRETANAFARIQSTVQFSLFLHPDQAQNTSSGIQGQEATAAAVI